VPGAFHKHHYVPLDAPPESIRSRFARTALRQVLSKAEKESFVVSLGSTQADLDAFYRLFFLTRRKLGLPAVPPRFFQSLWDVYGPSKHISLVLVRHGSRTVGAVLALKFRDVYAIEFSGDLDEFRHVGINQFLYWQALRNACEEGYKVFSFGRTSPKNTGLMEYKARWGAQVEDLPALFYPGSLASGHGDRDETVSFRLIRAFCRSMPMPAYRLIGGFLYRHWG
jgi:CelD/BcsL family acetyltransferase involved in cellulose biosynthesis